MKLTNIDISQSINNNPVAVNVYSKSEIHVGLSLKSYKHNNYEQTTDAHVCLSTLQAAIYRRV